VAEPCARPWHWATRASPRRIPAPCSISTEVGAYSEPTDTQFGVHIIRLDGIEPAGYKPFEAVRNAILTDIVKEVRTLTSKEIRGRYNLTDEAFIDGAAMEALFEPYRP
jgi:peptidyl-prolyl cis-trans isomerase C